MIPTKLYISFFPVYDFTSVKCEVLLNYILLTYKVVKSKPVGDCKISMEHRCSPTFIRRCALSISDEVSNLLCYYIHSLSFFMRM